MIARDFMLDEVNKYVNHKIGMIERMKSMSTDDPSNHDKYWFDRMEGHLSKDYHEFVGVDRVLAAYKKYLEGQEQSESSNEFMTFVKSTLDYKLAMLAKIDEFLKMKDMLHSERYYLKHLKEEIDKLTDVFILRSEKWERAIGRSDRRECIDLPDTGSFDCDWKGKRKRKWPWEKGKDEEEKPTWPNDCTCGAETEEDCTCGLEDEREDEGDGEEAWECECGASSEEECTCGDGGGGIVIPKPGKPHHGHGADFQCPLLKCVEALKAHGDIRQGHEKAKSNL
jgi:hypothetical protein